MKTKADIERLQAKIGQDILTLAHEDYGHQPVGKTKQMGFTFGDPKQKDLFDTGKVSEYVGDKENLSNVRETAVPATPLSQLPLTFDKRGDNGRSSGLRPTQRVRMQTTGRLRITAGKVRNPADTARHLSNESTAAQEIPVTCCPLQLI